MKSFLLKTFGCKLNQSDSAGVRGTLLSQGLREASAPEEADLIIVNTCTVTHRADQGARQAIRRLKSFAPDSHLVVTGCYAERDARLLAALPEVDEVFGLSQRKELFQYVSGIIPDDLDFGGFDPNADYGEKSRAFLKVQEGCDLKCSFCVIRLVRGRSRSLPAEEVIHRLQSLEEQGYDEVVLTGIHLGLWGRDLGIKGVGKGMLHLMKEIDKAEGMPKIRLNSMEPYVLNDEILQLMASSDRFAHHLHLSIQSGSEKILRSMRRRPDVDGMYHAVRRAKELMPHCGIGADVIVGFPGESDEDFRLTYDLLTGAPFSYAHVFSFSARPGTDAAKLPDKVHSKTISKRSATLRAAMAERNYKFRSSLLGEELSAVALQQEDDKGRQVMLTDNYVHVAIDGNEKKSGRKLTKLRVTKVDGAKTIGVIVV